VRQPGHFRDVVELSAHHLGAADDRADDWTNQTVYAILGNPKYTGHMVYGRAGTRNGRRVAVPADQWL
jgi:hypothetical protein